MESWPRVRKTRDDGLMLTLETPVERSTVPLASLANVLTTQLGGKPLIGIGGPKKQFAPGAQSPLSPVQSLSVVQATVGSVMQ